jgi:hypothetical protein
VGDVKRGFVQVAVHHDRHAQPMFAGVHARDRFAGGGPGTAAFASVTLVGFGFADHGYAASSSEPSDSSSSLFA